MKKITLLIPTYYLDLKKQFNNLSKFAQTSSFLSVTLPTLFGRTFILQK